MKSKVIVIGSMLALSCSMLFACPNGKNNCQKMEGKKMQGQEMMGKGMEGKDFNEVKTHILSKLKEHQSCVEKSTSFENLKECHPKPMKEHNGKGGKFNGQIPSSPEPSQSK